MPTVTFARSPIGMVMGTMTKRSSAEDDRLPVRGGVEIDAPISESEVAAVEIYMGELLNRLLDRSSGRAMDVGRVGTR